MVTYLGSCFLGILVIIIVLAALVMFIYLIVKARRMRRRIYIEPPDQPEGPSDGGAGTELEEPSS
jgi:preprotein translocase subunit SecY